MQAFYPSIKTYAEHELAVDDMHVLYIEECGVPDGIPIVVLHSGPGAGCESFHRRFFDPEKYRIILYDQRGAGRSKPYAELKNNTTQDLVNDLEAIRKHLGIQSWVLFGSAWGCALALVYAETHPERTLGLIVSSIFLGREQDINWFYKKGANKLFPDYWQDFIQPLNKKEKENPLQAYHDRLTGNDELLRMSTAKSWSLWQARCNALQPHSQIIDHFSDPHFAVSLATIESHYFVNHCFLEENQIMENIGKIQHIPTYIIHGRYNIVCPLQCAWELHKSLPHSELYIIRDAGHSPREPGIIDASIIATKKMVKIQTTSA